MQNMPNAMGAILRWERLKKTPTAEYELKDGEKVVAKLQWTKSSGSLAIGESAHGKWSFKRVGFFATQITVRAEGSDTDLINFVPSWTGDGTVKFADGRTVIWKSTSFWKASYILTDETGQEILSIKPDSCLSPGAAEVILGSRKIEPAALSLLAILALYVGILAASDGSDTALMVTLMGSFC